MFMKKGIWAVTAVLVMILGIVSGCGNNSVNTDDSGILTSKKRVGF